MATAVKAGGTEGKAYLPVRLTGDLAVAVNIPTSGTANERIDVRGVKNLSALVKTAAPFQGTLSIDLHPMLSPATTDDTDAAGRSVSNLPTTVTITAVDTEARITMDVSEYAFVEIELKMSGVASDETDIAYVDMYFTPLEQAILRAVATL